jgi:hypothetical protein
MKKSLLIVFGLTFALLLGSCNKKLKKELDELKSDLDATKSELNSVKNQSNNNASLLGSSTPITVTINNANRQIDSVAFSGTYVFDFKWDNNSDDTYIRDNGNGTYDIYIERYGSVEGSDYVDIFIDNWDLVSPITSNVISVYAEKYMYPSDLGQTLYWWTEGYLNHASRANTLTINTVSYNPQTRYFVFDVTSNTPENWAYGSTKNPESVRFQWSGTLATYNTVSRIATSK